jgi:hypothetical protein
VERTHSSGDAARVGLLRPGPVFGGCLCRARWSSVVSHSRLKSARSICIYTMRFRSLLTNVLSTNAAYAATTPRRLDMRTPSLSALGGQVVGHAAAIVSSTQHDGIVMCVFVEQQVRITDLSVRNCRVLQKLTITQSCTIAMCTPLQRKRLAMATHSWPHRGPWTCRPSRGIKWCCRGSVSLRLWARVGRESAHLSSPVRVGTQRPTRVSWSLQLISLLACEPGLLLLLR